MWMKAARSDGLLGAVLTTGFYSFIIGNPFGQALFVYWMAIDDLSLIQLAQDLFD